MIPQSSTNSPVGTPGTTPGRASLFGAPPSTTPAFGSPAPAPAFGAPSAATTPATGGFGFRFGSPAPAPTNGFAGFGAATHVPVPTGFSSTFGAPTPAPAFGAPATSSGLFGASPTPVATTIGVNGTLQFPYSDTRVDGASTYEYINMKSIVGMAQYDKKSFEELRLEDYMAGNKGAQRQNFGRSTFGAPVLAPTGGLFGAAPVTSTFGAPAPTAFESPTPYSVPAPSGGLFGFSAPATSISSFGAPATSTFGSLGSAELKCKTASSDADKALAILEKGCKDLENSITKEYLSQKSIEEIEMIEEQIRVSLDRVVTTKMNKLSQQVENRSCVICQVEPKTVLLMPCRHLCVCEECSQNHHLLLCPLCRKKISDKISVYS